MNTTEPFGSPESPLENMGGQASTKVASTMEAAREKLESARDTAREKLESARNTARDAMHTAREKVESAGSSILQWTRENPATALAAFFASGFVIGCALTMSRHEKTFGERMSEDPLATLRQALSSALAPVRDGIYSAADTARSAAEKVADTVTHHHNGHSLSNRLRDLGDNLKFW